MTEHSGAPSEIFAYCIFCGSTVGQQSERTDKEVHAVFDCPKCWRNYCDQCSSAAYSDGRPIQRCLRCDSEMDFIAGRYWREDTMPMLPFYTKFPDIAAAETRTAQISGDEEIPDGEYGFLELYCNETGCDCRRVFIQVIRPEAIDAPPLAIINFGWESEAFYRDWIHASENDDIVAEMMGPSLALAEQSELAPCFLELFDSMVEDPAYVDRLRRHYELFRHAVEKEHREEILEPHTPQKRIEKSVGPNKPCPCGSGKKFKKCCGDARRNTTR